jgi:hypothetical protein
METHEPEEPMNWPEGHVTSRFVDSTDVPECICVTVHGVEHYLHATTARELVRWLSKTLDDWNDHAATELRKQGLTHRPVYRPSRIRVIGPLAPIACGEPISPSHRETLTRDHQ